MRIPVRSNRARNDYCTSITVIIIIMVDFQTVKYIYSESGVKYDVFRAHANRLRNQRTNPRFSCEAAIVECSQKIRLMEMI